MKTDSLRKMMNGFDDPEFERRLTKTACRLRLSAL